MKVILVNGSPHSGGTTDAALKEVAAQLGREGIETEFFWIGNRPMPGCIACGNCKGSGKCAVNEVANRFKEKARSADGFIFGSPVHYAAITGAMSAFMSCAFFSEPKGENNCYIYKPAAAVITARRAGTTAAFDQMNKFFTIAQMPVISSCYWNMVHGANAEEAAKDGEGMYVMRTLAKNMAYFLKCIEAGKKAGLPLPEKEPGIRTNFIR